MIRKGVTLLELLIVVLIVGILATIAVPRFSAIIRKVKYAEAMQVCGEMYLAFEAYYMEYEKFPRSFDDLEVYPPEESIIPECYYAITYVRPTPNSYANLGISYQTDMPPVGYTGPMPTDPPFQKLGIWWEGVFLLTPSESDKKKVYWWREDLPGTYGGGDGHEGWQGIR